MALPSEYIQRIEAAKDQMKESFRQAMADRGFDPASSSLLLISVFLDLAHEYPGQRADIGTEMVKAGFAVLGVNADLSIVKHGESAPADRSTRH